MLNKTRKKYRGGALVGQGTYGCGFFPGFSCSNDANASVDSKVFSKLMTLDDAKEEFKINDIIRVIDSDEKYSIYPDKICNLDPKDYDTYKKDGIRDCKLIPSKKLNSNIIKNITTGKLKLLQSSFGGPTLYSYINHYYKLYNNNAIIQKKQQFIDIMYVLDGLENLFKGLVHYHEHNFAHLDIKDDNIVISLDNDISKCKFIDFGLSNLVSKFDKLYSTIPPHIPVDLHFLMYWSKFYNENHTINMPNNQIKSHIENIVDTGSIPLENIGSIHDSNGNIIHDWQLIQEEFINILSELYTLNEFNSKTVNDEVRYLILTGVDVYGLGFVLSRVLYFMLDIKMYYGTIYDASKSTVIKDSDTVLPVSILTRLFDLVKSMTETNPLNRYSAEEAYDVYSEIMLVLRRARSWGLQKKSKKGFVVVNKNKTRKSIKKLENILLSKSRQISLEPYLSSDVIDNRA
jgi:serine/threonine protein kinase